jgi:flagellar biosynthesis component FlhA
MMTVFAFVPGMPRLPFLLLAAISFVIARALRKAKRGVIRT